MSRSKTKPSTVSPKRSIRPIWLGALALVVVAIAVGVFLVLQNANNAGRLPAEISVKDAAARRDSGAFILDVREPEEWADFHVPGSTLISLGKLPERLSEVPRDKEIVVVCRSGNRSTTGRDILLNAGFTRVTSMAGGLRDWRAQGYPTVGGQ